MAKKKQLTNAMRILDAAKIKYDFISYDYEGEPGENFGAEIAALTGIPAEKSFKTLVLRGAKCGLITACIPVNAEADLKKLAQCAGDKKVEMIHVRELQSLTGYIRGGVSPIGMKKLFPTFFDAGAENFEKIAVSGGRCGSTLMISPSDLKIVTNCTFCDIIK